MSAGITHANVGTELASTEYHSTTAHELASGTSFPGSPSEQDLFYRTDEHLWYIRTNTAWVELTSQKNDLMAIGSNLLPDTANTYDIGSVDYEWENLYIGNGAIYLRTDQGETISSDGGSILLESGDMDYDFDSNLNITLKGNTTTNPVLEYRTYNSAQVYYRPTIRMSRARGTEGTEVALSSGDWLGSLNWSGWDGAGFVSRAVIKVQAAEAWDTANTRTSMTFGTTAEDATVDYVQLDADGHWIPTTANVSNLGSAAKEWGNVYIGTGRIYFYTDQGESIDSQGSIMRFYTGGNVQRLILGDDKLQTTVALTDAFDLGTTTAVWRNLYMGQAGKLYFATDQGESISSDGTNLILESAGAVVPSDVAGTNLGSADNEWNNLYVGGYIYFYTDQAEYIYSSGTNLVLVSGGDIFFGPSGDNVSPWNSNDISLGDSANEWKDLFLAGQLKLFTDQEEYIYSDGTFMYLGVGGSNTVGLGTTSLYPIVANTIDLGGSTNEFKDLYLQGVLKFYSNQDETIHSDGIDLILGSGGAVRVNDADGILDDTTTGSSASSPSLYLRGNYWNDPSNVQQEARFLFNWNASTPYLSIYIDDETGTPTEFMRMTDYYMSLQGSMMLGNATFLPYLQLDNTITGSTGNSGYIRFTGNYFSASNYEIEGQIHLIGGVDPYIRFAVDTTGTSGTLGYPLRIYDDVLTPHTDEGSDLGTASLRWLNVYATNVDTGDIHLANGMTITEDGQDTIFKNAKGEHIFRLTQNGDLVVKGKVMTGVV